MLDKKLGLSANVKELIELLLMRFMTVEEELIAFRVQRKMFVSKERASFKVRRRRSIKGELQNLRK